MAIITGSLAEISEVFMHTLSFQRNPNENESDERNDKTIIDLNDKLFMRKFQKSFSLNCEMKIKCVLPDVFCRMRREFFL